MEYVGVLINSLSTVCWKCCNTASLHKCHCGKTDGTEVSAE